MGKRWQTAGFLIGLACFVVWGIARSEHLPHLAWMARYTSGSGTDCCSERDCVPASVALPRAWVGEEQIVVLVDGVSFVLPTKSVHRSEDGRTYWCCKTGSEGKCPTLPTSDNTRCVFYAAGV